MRYRVPIVGWTCQGIKRRREGAAVPPASPYDINDITGAPRQASEEVFDLSPGRTFSPYCAFPNKNLEEIAWM